MSCLRSPHIKHISVSGWDFPEFGNNPNVQAGSLDLVPMSKVLGKYVVKNTDKITLEPIACMGLFLGNVTLFLLPLLKEGEVINAALCQVYS